MASSGCLIAVSRPTQPTSSCAVDAELGAHALALAAAARAERSKPYGITSIRSGGATPSETRSSRTSSLTATSTPVRGASARSTSANAWLRRGEK